MQNLQVDVLIIGGGVAGLSAASALGDVNTLVLTKTSFGKGGSTPLAQGGIAVALAKDDNPRLHARDTLIAGDGLSTADVVHVLTSEGPQRVRELHALGAQFDRGHDGDFRFGKEAAHSRRRIVHAQGDSTGLEVERALSTAVRDRKNLQIVDNCYVSDLLVQDGRIIGAQGIKNSKIVRVFARATILASGGIGGIYQYTTNPLESCGDGLAMAGRVGAVLSDVEFVQFHPTALNSHYDPLPLLTEALRGEGATLRDGQGRRFMKEYHKDAELAPRDVVARGIWATQQAGSPTYLDARIVGVHFPKKFPTVWELCQRAGLDPRYDLLPVTPAAHYHMGGVRVDSNGRSSCTGLWACGEVSATGVHGANRLASNSLLEGLVFGARVGEDILEELKSLENIHPPDSFPAMSLYTTLTQGEEQQAKALRKTLWDKVGLVRNEEGMLEALSFIYDMFQNKATQSLMMKNMLDAALIVTQAALQREESRGGHYRSDFPAPSGVASSNPFVYTGNGPWL